MVFSKTVTVESHGHDKYKRTIGDVFLSDGTHVNRELVAQGWCWWYQKYAPDDLILGGLETTARVAKKGLWADPHPVPPWEYRKARRGRLLDFSDIGGSDGDELQAHKGGGRNLH